MTRRFLVGHSGRVLCFVDADTIVPENAVDRISSRQMELQPFRYPFGLSGRSPGC